MSTKGAFDKGFEAARLGGAARFNPYVVTSQVGRVKRAAWLAGWRQARRIMEEEKANDEQKAGAKTQR